MDRRKARCGNPQLHRSIETDNVTAPLISRLETDAVILTIFPHTVGTGSSDGEDVTHLAWYRWWLDQQLENVPGTFCSLLPDGEDKIRLQEAPSFSKVFLEIAHFARTEPGPSIDGIVEHLVSLKLLKKPDSLSGTLQTCRTLVFAILGWQTMLYTPSFGTSPPKQFAIGDDLDGYRGQTFLVLRQDQICAKRRLSSLLMGFGLLLPPPNTCFSEDPDERQAFENITVIQSGELNVFLLQSIAHVRIKWIDVLAPHLEFNKATNTLYLFRYPSFCVANLASDMAECKSNGVLHRYVAFTSPFTKH